MPRYLLYLPATCEMRGGAKLGSSGSDVRCLEERLDQVSRGGALRFEVDSVFDEDTEAAIEQFQEVNGLTVDGIAGPETATLLAIWPGSSPPNRRDPFTRQPHPGHPRSRYRERG